MDNLKIDAPDADLPAAIETNLTEMTLYLTAGVAGIHSVATIPSSRRQGIAAAMTATPLLLARELGYHVGVLQASKMGYPGYRRLGFREYCRFNDYKTVQDESSSLPACPTSSLAS